ncbi:MAG: 50S ribosomal protein L10 [Candidatus Roizmanbacteria bacterium]|nr:50S ribosomal protein L10 [Candidatus Roizmanbacteria bacterium]
MKLKFRLQHIPRELRVKRVQGIDADLENAKSIILFKSLGVPHTMFEQLRATLDQHSAKLRFLKNTLFKIAAKGKKLPEGLYSDKILFGPTGAIVIYSDDFIPALKAFVEAFKDDERIEYKIGYIENTLYEGEKIIAFASIPSRDQLIAQLAMVLKNPLMRLHRALTFDTTRLVRGLKQVVNQKSTS